MNRESESEKSEVASMSDTDIERLLNDAYAVPAVFPSLLGRLEREVAEQWGASAKVVRKNPNWLIEKSSHFVRSWQAWPVAASLTLALILALVFRSDAHAYSWAAVVEALGNRPVVQLGVGGATESETSWLSIADRKIGQRSRNVERVFDLAQGVVLERGREDSQAQRFKLSNALTTLDRNRIALSFLVGKLPKNMDELDLLDFQPTEESWKRVGDVVELKVTLGRVKGADSLTLTLLIDPQSHLPKSCLVSNRDGVIRQAVLSYPQTAAETLIAKVFPADMPVIDVPSGATSIESSATRNSSKAADDTVSPKLVAGVENNQQALSPSGAASLGWSPIVASRLSNEQAIAAINATLERLWRGNDVAVVEPASDAELMRRVYLDLAGRTPTVTEVRRYLNDTSPDRYVQLVDRLLDSPDHATHLATVWRSFLLPEGVDLSRFGGVAAFDEWLSGRFGKNVAYDQLVRELLLADGRLSQSGPLLFYSAAKLDAEQLAARMLACSLVCGWIAPSATMTPSSLGPRRTFGVMPHSLPASLGRKPHWNRYRP